MGASRQLMRRALAGALPASRFMVHGPRSSNQLALTFDDGPHPDITPKLLDLLQATGLRATFFVIGREAERYPALIARMAEEGHSVGHHSWTHSEPSMTGAGVLLAEVARCRTLLRGILGRDVDLFRPPKGQLTAGKLLRLLAAGQRVVLWSSDPKDYALPDAGPLKHWAATTPLTGGDVILMHDTRSHCLEGLPLLCARAAGMGCEFVPLDTWLPA